MQRVQKVIKHLNDYDELVQELVDNHLPSETPSDQVIKGYFIKRLHDMRCEIGLTVSELRRYGCRRER